MEKAFNAFLYYTDDVLHEIGYICHQILETDQETNDFLQSKIEADYPKAIKQKLSKPIHLDDFMAMCRIGTHLSLFEDIFQKEKASENPLVMLTPIVNGKPEFVMQASHEPFSYSSVPDYLQKYPGTIPDYLVEYTKGNSFNMPQLINDDYFEAIRLLYKNKHYISATKLLLSCLDTLAFIEYGDIQGNFQKWLDTYADLPKHNITSEELWELRNSLLHMTNLDSRKMKSGKVSRIIVFVGNVSEENHPKGTEEVKFMNLTSFVHTFSAAISAWMTTYNETPTKIVDFIKRYDLTVSDKRTALVIK